MEITGPEVASPVVDSVEEEETTRKKFGTRYLTDPQNVFQHNAWDNAVWDEEQEIAARSVTLNQAKHAASSETRDEFQRDAAKYWDKFYNIHTNRFFKDRHWLFTEFPELYGQNSLAQCEGVMTESEGDDEAYVPVLNGQKQIVPDQEKDVEENLSLLQSESAHFHGSQIVEENTEGCLRLWEVGCGVGNTVFPLLKTNKNPNLFVYCCDLSSTAIDIVKAHPDYDEKRCHAFVHDITDENLEVPFQLESLDIIILIFVLSALSPEMMQSAVNRLVSYLKPGGTLLFRDYGRYDMAQLRFKQGRCLSENFYVRGDGTRVYFFTQDELKSMFTQAGLKEKENIIDRRLQVNRSRQLKMYRVWIQCKYVKPV